LAIDEVAVVLKRFSTSDPLLTVEQQHVFEQQQNLDSLCIRLTFAIYPLISEQTDCRMQKSPKL
jgi:hypothetical protein